MTPYLRTVAHGGSVSRESWQAHLMEFHRVFADATSLPMQLLQAPGDASPYAYAAQLIHATKPDARSVLDLGCGDGRLLLALSRAFGQALSLQGIDLSESEAERARMIVPQAQIATGDAASARYDANAFDLVTGHLSFALMPRLREVFARVHEWLVPGGALAIVLEDPLRDSAVFRGMCAAMEPVRRRFPTFAPIVPERDRCEDDAVLAVLLRDGGFAAPPEIERYALASRLRAHELWEILRRTYALGLLPVDLQHEAQAAMTSALGDLDENERVDVSLPLRFVAVQK
jgi:SAM-dependent methyltransferase